MADRYFVGDTDSHWNDASNWSATSGGAGGAGIPTSADIAYFDANSPDCLIDAIAVCNKIDSTGYTNTLTQGAGITLDVSTGGIVWASGTFVGSNAEIDLNTSGSSFVMSGGTFTSTSDSLSIRGNFTKTGGTFNHNNGEVRIYQAIADYRDPTFSADNVLLDLYDLNVDLPAQNLANKGNCYIQSDLNVTNNLTFTSGLIQGNGGLIRLKGNAVIVNSAVSTNTLGFFGGTCRVIMDDGSPQNLTASSNGYFCGLEIENGSTVTVVASPNLCVHFLRIKSGTFTAPTGVLKIGSLYSSNGSGNDLFSLYGGLDSGFSSGFQTGGTFVHSNGHVIMSPNNGASSGTHRIRSATDINFYDLTIAPNTSNVTNAVSIETIVAVVANDLTLGGTDATLSRKGSVNGAIEVGGDMVIADTIDNFQGGLATIRFTGAVKHTYTCTDTANKFPSGLAKVLGGGLILNSDLILNTAGQDLTIDPGCALCTNGNDLTVSDVLTNNGQLRAPSGDTVTYGSLVGNAILVTTYPATITKAVGTTGHDYSTITLWEADLDNWEVYLDGDDAVGECYADSNFNENVTINGGITIGLSLIKLTVASGERHDGTAGTGVEIVKTSTGKIIDHTTAIPLIVEWLSIDANGYNSSNAGMVGNNANAQTIFRNLIVHGATAGTVNHGIYEGSAGRQTKVVDCIVYDIDSPNTSGNTTGIYFGGLTDAICYNNTVCSIDNSTAGVGGSIGIQCSDRAGCFVENNIVMNVIATGGTAVDFSSLIQTPVNATVDYNMSEDATATGANSLASRVYADQFVSVVAGSEDLHLKAGADAIGAGVDLGTTYEVQIDIDGCDRDLRGATWDIGADQAVGTITKTIGTGKDYTTISGWTTGLNSAIYQTGDTAIGSIEANEVFDEGFTVTTTEIAKLAGITLTVAEAYRHNGTAGTGARLVMTTSNNINLQQPYITFEWLEVDFNGNRGALLTSGTWNIAVFTDGANIIRNCIVHGAYYAGFLLGVGLYQASKVYNNIVYDITSEGSSAIGINDLGAVDEPMEIYNNTVYGIEANTGTGYCRGIAIGRDLANRKCKNNIVSNVGGSTSGAKVDFYFAGTTLVDTDYNASEDTTAVGANSITGIVPADQFVNIGAGTEDFHLKAGSDAIGVGTDLGTTEDVQIDIDGCDRDLRGMPWDMGADQIVGTVTKTIGTGQDYATITAWEADLDSAGYQSGDDAVGSIAVNEVFTETVTINGGGTIGLNSILLTVASGVRHNGIAGSGAVLTASANSSAFILSNITPLVTIEWLEIDGWGGAGYLVAGISRQAVNSIVRNCIIHGARLGNNGSAINVTAGSKTYNNIIYDENAYDNIGINDSNGYISAEIYNNTVYGFGSFGIYKTPSANTALVVTNNICMNNGTEDFKTTSYNASSGYNMSSDASAPGSNSLINKVTADQFVNIGSGTEDFHLKAGSDAIHEGTNLGSTDGVNYDIDNNDRTANGRLWDIGADQRPETITKTIGTTGRDYTVPSLWEADLDDTSIYIEGDIAQGVMYDDSDFTDNCEINGGATIGLSQIILTVDSGSRHDGTAYNGVNISNINSAVVDLDSSVPTIVEWIIGYENGNGNDGVFELGNVGDSAILRNCIARVTTGAKTGILGSNGGENQKIYNNIVFDGETPAYATKGISSNENTELYNNTCFGRGFAGGVGIYNQGNDANSKIKPINTIAMGYATDFFNDGLATWGTDSDYNMSSDATAPGSNSLKSKVTVSQFVSTTLGAEDLHLKAGTDAYQVGGDLGTTDNINIDIDGVDRDALGDPWCIGAHQLLISMLVTAITPDSGSVLGVQPVIIGGIGFQVGALAYIDGVLSTSIVFVSALQLTAKTPSGSVGAKDVRVVNLDSSEATLVSGYTYIAQPAPVPAKEYRSNRSQPYSITGCDLIGKRGARELGTYAWFNTLEAKDFTLDFEFNGSLASDIEIAVQACLIGGESHPKTIITLNPTSGQTFVVEPLKAYDRVRAVVTKLDTAGLGSQVVLSGRI